MSWPRFQAKPCAECPWRLDVAPGQFPPERFTAAAGCAHDMAASLFACHKSTEGADVVCAGFLIQGAMHNLSVRMMRLEPGAVTSDHPLHRSYRAMAIAHGVPPDHPALADCRDPGYDQREHRRRIARFYEGRGK